MNLKKISKKSDLTITIILIIGILVVVNFLSYQIFHRWDLTENKVFSLSQVSKKTVGELEDVVNIKVYFSENLPIHFMAVRQEVEDILEEYKNYSNGNIRVEFIDPKDDEETQRELYMKGVPQLAFDVFEKDKRQTVNGYTGMIISFSDKSEVIPVLVENTNNLEYQITTKIKKVISDEIATIGIVTDLGSMRMEDINFTTSELMKLYNVENISLSGEVDFLDGIDTLVIVGPSTEMTEEQMKSINSFLVRGGSLFVLIDGVIVSQGMVPEQNKTNFLNFLENYGIKVNQNLIADLRNGIATFSQGNSLGNFAFSTNYPFWPKINSEGFNQDNVALTNLENVVLPWSSSIEIFEDRIAQEDYSNLAFSTDSAWQEKDSYNISPKDLIASPNRARYNFAVNVNGEINNAYSDENQEKSKFPTRIIVIGDSDFILDSFVQGTPDNLTLFLNLVDSLSFDEDIIKIRSKNVSSRPIQEDLRESTKATIKYGNIFGLTVLVVLLGMIRYYLRRKSKFVDEI